MNVLVTGGGGFAGRHLLRELHSRGGANVAATVLGEVPEFSPEEGLAGVEWYSLDLSDPESIGAVLDAVEPDQIYHLAGQASVGDSFADPLLTWEINATGTLRLLERWGAGSPDRRFLLASSAEVYGTVPPGKQPIDESTAVAPLTPYGTSKAAAELITLQSSRMLGFSAVVARSFNHIGPGQDERFVLPSFSRQLARIARGDQEAAMHVGNLDVVRDFLDVRDVAAAYVTLMERGQDGRAYNIASGQGRTLRDLVLRLIDLSDAGARLEVDEDRVRSVDIPQLVGDASAMRGLGWKPSMKMDETLQDLLGEARAAV